MILYAIELVVAVLAVYVISTQVIIPLAIGGKIFPIFRYKGIRRELTEAEEKLEYSQLEEELQKKLKELKNRRDKIYGGTKRDQ
jgi:F0F1-type ATP synthase membrane subunit b/b'